MPVRTIDRPSWLLPRPTRVCVSAVDQALPQMDCAAPNPSTTWYLVAVFTVMSGVPMGPPVVGPAVVGRADVGTVLVGAPDVTAAVVVGAPEVRTGTPVQATPFSAKLVGEGLLPFHEPLKPKDAEPLVGMAPL